MQKNKCPFLRTMKKSCTLVFRQKNEKNDYLVKIYLDFIILINNCSFAFYRLKSNCALGYRQLL